MKTNYHSRLISIAFFLGLMSVKTIAINYSISFTGSGASTTIDSVIVQNLTKGTTMKVLADMSLILTDVTAIEPLNADNESISIFPNPVIEKATMSFYAKQNGNAKLSIVGLDGRKVITTTQAVQAGKNSFQLSLPWGAYLIQVIVNNYSKTIKAVSQSGSITTPELIYTGVQKMESMHMKSANSVVSMPYSRGDQLIYKGCSGNNKTLVSDIPTQSKITNFEFMECKDAAGRYYTITKIGNQTWMAENLAYLPVAASAPDVGLEDEANYTTKSTPYYYVNNKAKYGVLYNWYASLTAAPSGWHLPSDAEWTTLSTYLGGEGVAGGKMKTTTSWNSPNTGAANSSCFTALPGGDRYYNGFNGAGNYGYWWSSTKYYDIGAWKRTLRYDSGYLHRAFDGKVNGFSVRCVRD